VAGTGRPTHGACRPGGRRRSLYGIGESRNVDRAEDVTAAQLGASPWQAQAFRGAVFSSMLRWWVTEREAIWASCDRRGLTAV
jgi:hypothetical protein